VDGFDLNCSRRCVARLNEQDMFFAVRKLRLESASQQLAHHKIFARWNARLSLPPISSVCGLAHRASGNSQFIEPRTQAVQVRRTAIAVELRELRRRASRADRCAG
jgi:hypothetical protein